MNNQFETRESRQGPRIVAVVLVLALIAALVYVQTRQSGEAPDDVPAPAPAPAQLEPAPDSAGARERGDQARAIIERLRAGESQRDLDAIFARAREFQEQGRVADAYLLYFYAAREGDAASALMLGRMYDPTGPDELKTLVDEPIAAQAFKWYRAAADAGSESAADYLANLRGWAEDAAARGDAEARRLLLLWQ